MGAGAPVLWGGSLPSGMTGPELLREILDDGAAAGFNVVRFLAHGVSRETALQTAPGAYSGAAWKGLDYALAEAGARGLRVILALTSNWGDIGSVDEHGEGGLRDRAGGGERRSSSTLPSGTRRPLLTPAHLSLSPSLSLSLSPAPSLSRLVRHRRHPRRLFHGRAGARPVPGARGGGDGAGQLHHGRPLQRRPHHLRVEPDQRAPLLPVWGRDPGLGGGCRAGCQEDGAQPAADGRGGGFLPAGLPLRGRQPRRGRLVGGRRGARLCGGPQGGGHRLLGHPHVAG